MRVKIVLPKLDWLISKIDSLTIKVKDLSSKTSPRLNRASKRIVDFKNENNLQNVSFGRGITSLIGLAIAACAVMAIFPAVLNATAMNSNMTGSTTMLFSNMFPLIAFGVVASVLIGILR